MTSAIKSATGKKRGSYAKNSEKREAILAAALEVFSTRGYTAGSMRDVASRAGMSEPGMLYYFPSKSELLASVLEGRSERAREFIGDNDDDGHRTLNGYVRLAAHNQSLPRVVELFCKVSAEASATDHPAHDYFARRYRWNRQLLVTAFAAIDRAGELADGVDINVAARQTISMIDGLQVQWLLENDSVSMASDLRDHLSRLVLFELDPAPSSPIPPGRW